MHPEPGRQHDLVDGQLAEPVLIVAADRDHASLWMGHDSSLPGFVIQFRKPTASPGWSRVSQVEG